MERIGAYANVGALALTLLANALLGARVGPRSGALDTALTPAPPAFGIWWAIYALLIATVVAQLDDEPLRRALGPWFLLSCAGSVGWLAAFARGPVDAEGRLTRGTRSLAALLLLVALAGALLPLGALPQEKEESKAPLHALARAGASLYAGWLAVAATLGVLMALGPRQAESVSARLLVWLGLASVLGALGVAWRNPLLTAPLLWAALWRATRGDRTAAIGGALAFCASLAARR